MAEVYLAVAQEGFEKYAHHPELLSDRSCIVAEEVGHVVLLTHVKRRRFLTWLSTRKYKQDLHANHGAGLCSGKVIP